MAARAASARGWSTSSSTLRSLWTIRAPSATRRPLVGAGGLDGPAAEAGDRGRRVELGRPVGGVAVGGGRGPAEAVGGDPLHVAHGTRALGAGTAVRLLGQRGLPRLAQGGQQLALAAAGDGHPGGELAQAEAPAGDRADRTSDRGRVAAQVGGGPAHPQPAVAAGHVGDQVLEGLGQWGRGVPAQERQHLVGRAALVEGPAQAGVGDAPGARPGRLAVGQAGQPGLDPRGQPAGATTVRSPASRNRSGPSGRASAAASARPAGPVPASNASAASPAWARSPTTTATPRKAAASRTARTVGSSSSGPPAGSGQTIGCRQASSRPRPATPTAARAGPNSGDRARESPPGRCEAPRRGSVAERESGGSGLSTTPAGEPEGSWPSTPPPVGRARSTRTWSCVRRRE